MKDLNKKRISNFHESNQTTTNSFKRTNYGNNHKPQTDKKQNEKSLKRELNPIRAYPIKHVEDKPEIGKMYLHSERFKNSEAPM